MTPRDDTLAALSEPVAYLYVRPDGWTTVERKPQPDWVARGWTETPLYRAGQLMPVPSVEVVARAMAAEAGLDWDGKAKGVAYANHGYWMDLATAAIAAMKGENRK